MNKTLHLTKEEQKLFEALSDGLKEGWEVKEETQEFADTAERQKIRIELMQIHDKSLLGFKKKAEEVTNPQEMEKLLDELNLSHIHNEDLTQLFYGLGPNFVTSVIKTELQNVTSDEDIEVVASFCVIRHMLLESFVPAYS